MEEILIIILQVVIELFINIPWDLFVTNAADDSIGPVAIGFISLVAGGIFGAPPS